MLRYNYSGKEENITNLIKPYFKRPRLDSESCLNIGEMAKLL